MKNPWWIFLLSGIILFLGIVTPGAFYSYPAGSINIWMWGLISIYIRGYGTAISFATNPVFLIPSYIITLIMVLCLFGILIVTYLIKTRLQNFKWESFFMLIISVVSLVTIIWWIIFMEAFFAVGIEELDDPAFTSFWGIFAPGFGVIGIFIEVIINIFGIVYIRNKITKTLRDISYED